MDLRDVRNSLEYPVCQDDDSGDIRGRGSKSSGLGEWSPPPPSPAVTLSHHHSRCCSRLPLEQVNSGGRYVTHSSVRNYMFLLTDPVDDPGLVLEKNIVSE